MHIVVYCGPFFPKMGGLERNTATLCSALADLGHDVTLVTETGREEKDHFPFQVVRDWSIWELFRYLGDADFVFTNGGNVPLRVTPLAYLQGVPYGAIYHGFRGFRTADGAWASRLKNSLRWFLARRAAVNIFTSTHSKKMTRVSEATAHVLLNPVGKKLQEKYDGEDDQSRADAPFLFAGRLIAGKGIFFLADALQELDGEQQLKLVVAGEGRDEKRFRDRLSSLDTIDVTFAGRLGARDLVSLYQRSKALIVPTTTHKEGNPLVIAEALYAGTPVIASNQPPMIESVGDAGHIVEAGEVEALAAAIRRVHTDKSHYKMLRQKAEARANKFSYELYTNKIGKITNNIF